MINVGNSTAIVKGQIEDAVALAGYSAPTSWADATDKINGTANQFERGQIAGGMNGGLARDRINALFGGPVWAPEDARLTIDFADNKAWTRNSAVTDSVDAVSLTRSGSALMLGPDGYESFPANTLARIDGVGAQVAPASTRLTHRPRTPFMNWSAIGGLTKTAFTGTFANIFSDAVRAGSNGADWNRLQSPNGISWTSGTTYGFTMFISAGTSGRARIILLDSTASTETRIRGVVGALSTVQSSAGTISNLKQTEILPDIWEIKGSFTPNATVTSQGLLGIGPDSNTAGQDVIFYGGWLESCPYPTPIILGDEGAAVSRPGDILSASVPDGGRAFVFEFDLLEPLVRSDTIYRRILEFNNGINNANSYSVAMHPTLGQLLLTSRVAGAIVGSDAFTQPIPATGRVILAGVASSSYRRLTLSGTDSDTQTIEAEVSGISRVGIGGNGRNSDGNPFCYPGRFTERPITDFATPADAFAWAKSIAQGWA